MLKQHTSQTKCLRSFKWPIIPSTWWRHQMETFSALLAICAGNSPVTGELPAQRPVTRRFDVFFDLRLNKPLSKQWWGWWFEMLSHQLWRHCNVNYACLIQMPSHWFLLPILSYTRPLKTFSEKMHRNTTGFLSQENALVDAVCILSAIWEQLGL